MRSGLCAGGCGRELATYNDDPSAAILCWWCHPSDLALNGGEHDRGACGDCQRLIAEGRLADTPSA